MKQLCSECVEVEEKLNIDIAALLDRLAEIRGGKLPDREQSYLCLSLCGYCNYEIAFRWYRFRKPTLQEIAQKDKDLEKPSANIRTGVAASVSSYIKILMGIEGEKPSLGAIADFLRENGFAKEKLRDRNEDAKRSTQFFLMIQGDASAEDVIKTLKQHYNIDFTQILKSTKDDETGGEGNV
jgi:hypothetical protein